MTDPRPLWPTFALAEFVHIWSTPAHQAQLERVDPSLHAAVRHALDSAAEAGVTRQVAIDLGRARANAEEILAADLGRARAHAEKILAAESATGTNQEHAQSVTPAPESGPAAPGLVRAWRRFLAYVEQTGAE